MDRFLHVGRITLIVGGLLLATGAGLQAATSGGDPFSVQVTTSAFTVSAALRLAGAIAMIIGLTALYLPAADRAARFGLVAFFLAVANLVMQASWMWADLFVTRAFAANAPGVLDGTADDGIMGLGFMAAWLFNATAILLGIALLRSRTYPRECRDRGDRHGCHHPAPDAVRRARVRGDHRLDGCAGRHPGGAQRRWPVAADRSMEELSA